MSYTVEQLLILATEFDKLAAESLEKLAAKNPKTKVLERLLSQAQQLDMEETPSNKLANNALMNDTNPITGRVPGAGKRYLEGLRVQGHISDKKYAEVLTLYNALLAAKHPRKASL